MSKVSSPAPIVDAQVHAHERDRAAALGLPTDCDGPGLRAAMDRVGVDAAVVMSSWHLYRADGRYAAALAATHPERFRAVLPVDVDDPALDRVLDDWAATPGTRGTRLMRWPDAPDWDAAHPGVRRVMAAAARTDDPVCVLAWDRLDLVDALARAHPDVRLVLDHAGLRQPHRPPAPPDAFAALPAVLALARHENVAVKLTGIATLSSEPPPHADLWPPTERILEAFGVDRTMWGSDWTRARSVPLEDALAPARDHWPLTPHERAALLGGTARRIFRWDR